MWFRGPRFLSRTLVSVAWRIGAGIFFCDGSGVKLIKHYSARSRRVKVMVEWEEFRKKHSKICRLVVACWKNGIFVGGDSRLECTCQML